VGFHRLGEELALGDLGIGEAAGGEGEGSPAPVGELGEGRWRRTQGAENRANSSRVAAAAMTAEPDCTVRIAASRNSGSASFRRKPLAPTNRAGGRLVEVERREHDDPRRRGARLGSASGSAVAARPSITGIRMSMSTTSGRPGGRRARLRPRLGFADDGQIRLRVDDHADAGAEKGLVVDEDDADRALTGPRPAVRTWKVRPGERSRSDRLPGDRQRGGHDEDLPAGRRLEVPADELRALAHADEPVSARPRPPRDRPRGGKRRGGSTGFCTLSSTLQGATPAARSRGARRGASHW
jgi:hypothetical protein